tara:strand:- start:106 stop:501 length:396 start_codon:yes stop_codon:yes gene_type:complete
MQRRRRREAQQQQDGRGEEEEDDEEGIDGKDVSTLVREAVAVGHMQAGDVDERAMEYLLGVSRPDQDVRRLGVARRQTRGFLFGRCTKVEEHARLHSMPGRSSHAATQQQSPCRGREKQQQARRELHAIES